MFISRVECTDLKATLTHYSTARKYLPIYREIFPQPICRLTPCSHFGKDAASKILVRFYLRISQALKDFLAHIQVTLRMTTKSNKREVNLDLLIILYFTNYSGNFYTVNIVILPGKFSLIIIL